MPRSLRWKYLQISRFGSPRSNITQSVRSSSSFQGKPAFSHFDFFAGFSAFSFFSIPTPVGNYSPDWAIAFQKDSVKHIFFVAETKGTMESLQLKPVEAAKLACARRLFNDLSTSHVRYAAVDSYQNLLNLMPSIR